MEREKIQLNIYNINIENIYFRKEKGIAKSKSNRIIKFAVIATKVISIILGVVLGRMTIVGINKARLANL